MKISIKSIFLTALTLLGFQASHGSYGMVRKITHKIGSMPSTRSYHASSMLHAESWTYAQKPHEILGVSVDASLKQAKEAYLKLVQEYHPDKGGSSEVFRKIYAAYEIFKQGPYNALQNDFQDEPTQSNERNDGKSDFKFELQFQNDYHVLLRDIDLMKKMQPKEIGKTLDRLLEKLKATKKIFYYAHHICGYDYETMQNMSEHIRDFMLEPEQCLDEYKKMNAFTNELKSWYADDKKEILGMLGFSTLEDLSFDFYCFDFDEDCVDTFACIKSRNYYKQIIKGMLPLIQNESRMNALLEKIKTAKKDFAHYDAWFKQHNEISKKHELLLELYRADFDHFKH